MRDWVVRFNADCSDGLHDRKVPNPTPRLSEAHRAALLEIIGRGPTPAIHGVVRWPNTDLGQWLWEEFLVSVSPQTLSRVLRSMRLRRLLLPSKCPVLNVMENVWQFMRDNWLSNRISKTYDDIVAQCCEAWSRPIDQPWRIISIGMRNWSHRY